LRTFSNLELLKAYLEGLITASLTTKFTCMKEAEKKTDRTLIIKELETRLLKKWKADTLSNHLPLSGQKPPYLKTIKNKKITKK